MLDPEGGEDQDLADERAAAAGEEARVGGAAAVVGVGEVPAPPGGQEIPEECEGGDSNDIRTTMERMEVGGDLMD